MLKIVISANYSSVIARKNGGFQQYTEFTLSLGSNFYDFPEETEKSLSLFFCLN